MVSAELRAIGHLPILACPSTSEAEIPLQLVYIRYVPIVLLTQPDHQARCGPPQTLDLFDRRQG